MSSKYLIFFLNVLVLLMMPLMSRSTTAEAVESVRPAIAHKKEAARDSQRLATDAAISVRLVWQVIRSQGQGALMNTSAESFSTEGQLLQVGGSNWELRAKGSSIFGSVIPARLGLEGVVIVHRGELLSLLGVSFPRTEESHDGDEGHAKILHLPIQQAPYRQQMETIYRGPEEELLLVKVAIMKAT